jgi:hypothetical protein
MAYTILRGGRVLAATRAGRQRLNAVLAEPSAGTLLPTTFFTIRTPVVNGSPQPPKIRMPEDEALLGPM